MPKPKPAGDIGVVDSDADWLALSEFVPAATYSARQPRVRFIPALPIEFLQKSLAARDALPVLLVAHAEMRMRRTQEISIGPGIWAAIGNPQKRIRSRLLRQLSQLPRELCVLTPRKGRPHLLRAGRIWPKEPRLQGV